MSIRKIADQSGISKTSVHNIINETKQKKKVASANTKHNLPRPNNPQTNGEPSLEGFSQTDKKQIIELKAKKVIRKLEREISSVEHEILQIEAAKGNLANRDRIIRLLIQVARTLISHEANFNDTAYQKQARYKIGKYSTFLMLFKISCILLCTSIEKAIEESAISVLDSCESCHDHLHGN
jgi:hypothetical protein